MNLETFVIFQTSPFRVVTKAVPPTKSSDVGRSSSSTLRERVERPVGTGLDVDEQAETGGNIVSVRPGSVQRERDDLPRRRDMRHGPCLGHEHRAVGHREPCGDDVLKLDPLRDLSRGRHVKHPVVVPVRDEESVGDGLERELDTHR